MENKEPNPESKRLRIVGRLQYKIDITDKTCDVNYDQSNEDNLAGLLISGIALENIMVAIASENLRTDREKRLRQAKIKKYKALYETLSEAVSDICTYIFETKTQADYDKLNEKFEGKKKSKIEVVKDIPPSIKKA